MKPAKIRYKGFEWEHNPETLSVIAEDNINEYRLSSGTSLAVKNSSKCRVIRGRGKLVGYDCLNKFNELLKLRCEVDSGILTLPQLKPFYAYFNKLELLCEPCENVITYSFEFVEDSKSNYTVKEKAYHKVNSGETLWDIAYHCKKDINELVKLNPHIARVDELPAGIKVRIC